MPRLRYLLCLLALVPAACQVSGETAGQTGLPGDATQAAWDGVRTDEVLRFTGTEPFWGGQVRGTALTWSTPEMPGGREIAVERFAGLNGLGFSGTLDGESLHMAVSAGECSDGMSDRTYPFIVTVELGGETLRGCGWTEARPFTGPQAP